MTEQRQGAVRQQIELPFAESVRISFQSLMIRFYRSIITTAGITLGIAFLVSVWTTAEVDSEIKKGSGQGQEIILGDEEEKEGKVTTKQLWLVTMSLIVCVVGIANAMLMSVTERFREIGTMKCLGALDGFVVRLFLLESAFQGFVGALIGALIGVAVSILMGLRSHGWNLVWDFPLLRILTICFICCLIGTFLAVIGAAFPSWRAAKLPPAEAMRVEV